MGRRMKGAVVFGSFVAVAGVFGAFSARLLYQPMIALIPKTTSATSAIMNAQLMA